jgi:hypothetical protein
LAAQLNNPANQEDMSLVSQKVNELNGLLLEVTSQIAGLERQQEVATFKKNQNVDDPLATELVTIREKIATARQAMMQYQQMAESYTLSGGDIGELSQLQTNAATAIKAAREAISTQLQELGETNPPLKTHLQAYDRKLLDAQERYSDPNQPPRPPFDNTPPDFKE